MFKFHPRQLHSLVPRLSHIPRAHDKTREEEERVTPIDAHTHGQNIYHVLQIERLKASLVESILLDL